MTTRRAQLPTVASLCGLLGEHLHPAPGLVAPPAEIIAVHISELLDPTAYISGGELLLTTGVAFAADNPDWESYVGRLAGVGIAALGLGLGPAYAGPPPELVRACGVAGLPLLVVPAPTPFLTVTTAYWEARTRSSERDLHDSLAAQRALLDAMVSPGPQAQLLRRTARLLGGWAATFSSAGRVDQVFPLELAAEADKLQREVARLEATGVRSAASLVTDGQHVAVSPLSAGGTVAGYLAVGTSRQLTAPQRRLMTVAVTLLSIAAHSRGSARSDEAAGRCVALLVDLGLTDAAQQLAARTGLPAVPREQRVLLVEGDDIDRLTRLVRSWCPPVLGVREDGRAAWFLLPGDHPDLRSLSRRLAGTSPDAKAVISGLTRAADVGATRTRLMPVLRRMAPGEHAFSELTHDERTIAVTVDQFLAQQPPQVVAALAAYLRHRGQWEQAARALCVHRNTLRYRVARARESLNLDIDDPDLSARVWLLLRSWGAA